MGYHLNLVSVAEKARSANFSSQRPGNKEEPSRKRFRLCGPCDLHLNESAIIKQTQP